MEQYQKELINFLIRENILSFGEFSTKIGRKTPYYFNFGAANTGKRIIELAQYYSIHISRMQDIEFNTLFGPSYKGIPLAVSICSEYYRSNGINLNFSSNRKEEKKRGEGGTLLGHSLGPQDTVLIVEDVTTSGSTFKEIVPLIRSFGSRINGIVIAVDREEKGINGEPAVREVEKEFDLKVHSLVKISDVINYLITDSECVYTLEPKLIERIQEYREKYGS